MSATVVQTTVEKLKEKLIQTALDLPEFRDLLRDSVNVISTYAKIAPNEASIASCFDREIYALLRRLDVHLEITKEIKVDIAKDIDIHRDISRGRIDSRIGAVVIEYKHSGKLKTENDIEKATIQLKNYLVGLSSTKPSFYYGFLTDGIYCKEITIDNKSVVSVGPFVEFTISEALRLIKNMVLLEKTALSPENLIKDFCHPEDNNLVYNMSKSFFHVLKTSPERKTQMLKTEWEQLFKLGHNDKSQQKAIIKRNEALEKIIAQKFTDGDQYTALFALQTAYALIMKLIAYRIICEIRFEKPLKTYNDMLRVNEANLRIFCATLEDGEIFRDRGIVNLLEGDFFSWYSSPTQWNSEIAGHIKKLLEILARYENASEVFKTKEAIDLFKRLYETIMPQVVRSSLGEFYTPSWLTEHVFRSVKPQGTWRGLDPCCGSGTFVLTMIDAVLKETTNQPKDQQLKSVLDRVHAIDLNPLAVLTARINYFIRISHLIPDRPSHLQIPVYLGDACYVPEKIKVHDVECLKYAIRTVEKQIDVTIPTSMVKNTQNFSELMTEYEKQIKKKDFDGSLKLLTEKLSTDEKIPSILKELEKLTQQLVELEKGEWNGIWARIINNFLITAELGQFEIIIGNPPWIDWKNLPSGYRDRIKSLCVDKKLFSGDHRTGGINLNICALISSVSMENWLKDEGKLAFLMPKVIAFQQSYDGYRKFQCNKVPRDFIAFYDWSRAGHPFHPITERFMTFVIGPKSERPEIIPVKNYVKRRKKPKIAGESHISLEEAMERLIEKEAVAGQIMPHNTAFTIADSVSELDTYRKIAGEADYIGREGLELYPQELLLFTLALKPPTQPREGCVYIQNLQFKKSIYPILPELVEIETKYLFPVVKSINIERFKHKYSGIIAPVPYDKSNSKQPLDQNQLKGTKLLDYFLKYREIFAKQTEYYQKIKGPNSGEFYGLARIGPYSFKEHYVAFRDSTKWRATVISPVETDWGGRKRFVFQNHAASICEDSKGNYITEDEAHYICAILNTPIVEKYIIQSSDSRSFKIRPPVKIPKFDAEKGKHTYLQQLSRKAHTVSEDKETLRKEMQETYLSILDDEKDKNPKLVNWQNSSSHDC